MADDDVLSSEGHTSDELSRQEPSTDADRPRPLVWVAATVVGVLVAAAGGYALGQSQDETVGAAPPISLGNSGANLAGDSSKELPAGVGSPEMRSGADIMPFGFGRIDFTAGDLPVSATSSDAWAYDPAAVFSKATAVSAAKALGVDGEPTLVGGLWTVGSVDGMGPTMQLSPDGLASLSYWNPLYDPYSCPTPLPGTDTGNQTGIEPNVQTDTAPSTGSGGGVAPGAPGMSESRDCEKRAVEAMSDADAIDRLKDLMEELGLDTSSYQFDATNYGVPESGYVIASQVVDGQQTVSTWNATFVGDKVQSLYGGLAPVVSLGDYDVISPVAAVDRLEDPRFGPGYSGPMPYPMAAMEAGPAMEKVESSIGPMPADDPVVAPQPKLPPTVQPGDLFAWPVTEITVTKARLGLALYTQPDGSIVLLPTYELSEGSNSMWSVVAVDDTSLDFSE